MAQALGLDPDASAVDFDDPPGQGQTYSGAVRVLVQLIEQPEDFLVVAGIDPDPVVANVADGLIAVAARTDFDPRPRLFSDVFHGVVDQVLQDLQEPNPVTQDGGQARGDAGRGPAATRRRLTG